MIKNKVIVVGGGLAGLMSAYELAEAGVKVELISQVTVKRSNSVCAQGGINAALNSKGQDDSVEQHCYDTIYAGDFLANQTPIKNMVEAAPDLVYFMDNLGVLFSRDEEGAIDLRYFGGTKKKRTAYAGTSTGQQLLYALDEQIRRLEREGMVEKFETSEFLQLILDENSCCRGCVVQEMNSMEILAHPGDAVIMATGGAGGIYGKSTNSLSCTGSAASILYQQGAGFANGEFIQFHPTAMLGADKTRLMSEAARSEGGRIWTYKEGKPWYFLEEWYPEYQNLVPRDVASRAIYKVCVEMGLGIEGKNQVYLDLTHLPEEVMELKLGSIVSLYQKFYGEDPRKVPMKIFPSVHYTMGGIHTDDRHQTALPGCFAAGECDYMYHGANRLGANSLLSALYSGRVAGPEGKKYAETARKLSKKQEERLVSKAIAKEKIKYEALRQMKGTENPFALYRELGEIMTENVGIIRKNDKLRLADKQLQDVLKRYENIGISDDSTHWNQSLLFVRRLKNMIHLARAITLSALERNESRGAHYKEEFLQRDDENFLKTTVATFQNGEPVIHYEAVDLSLVDPVKRDYSGK